MAKKEIDRDKKASFCVLKSMIKGSRRASLALFSSLRLIERLSKIIFLFLCSKSSFSKAFHFSHPLNAQN